MRLGDLITIIREACVDAGCHFHFGDDGNLISSINLLTPNTSIAFLNIPTSSRGKNEANITEVWSFSLFIGRQDRLANNSDDATKAAGTTSREQIIIDTDGIVYDVLATIKEKAEQPFTYRREISMLKISQYTGHLITFDLNAYYCDC